MSASSKKNLRNQQASAKLTEKQLAEMKEQKTTRLYTIAFAVVLAVLLVVAIVAGVNQQITSTGVRERKTVAMTVGSHDISNAELNYYYIDAINNFYSQNSTYISLYGLDVTKPLDQQQISEDGTTWADNFLESAKNNAKATYALVDEANAKGFTLGEDQASQIDSVADNLSLYATMYGYSDAAAYLKAMYGNGSSVEGFRSYLSNNMLADAYQTEYNGSLTYTAEDLSAYEQDRQDQYNAYTYNQYFLSTNNFLGEGTTDEDGVVTHTAEEKAAAAAAAEAAAKTMVGENITSVADMDKAISAVVEGAASTAYKGQLFSSVSSKIADWMSDSSRKEGDKTCIESSYTSTDEDGTEVTNVSGYYVVYFIDSTDNKFPMVNVRHILVAPEGGTTDDSGATVYSDEEKAAAKAKAEDLLAQWKSGEATEDSFAALATENTTDTGSKANGGLYENVYPGQMVVNFNDWCFDATRAAGDTGIVESDYGYHVMYFVGNSDTTYRDYLITNDLREENFNEWYTSLLDAATVTDGNTAYIRKNIVLSGNGI